MSGNKDPNGIDQHEAGAKLDGGKPLAGILGDFSRALMAVAEIGTYGVRKYTRGGWKSVPNGIERYTDALWRHLLKENKEPLDDESGLMHAAHMAWNSLARLELMLNQDCGSERMPPGWNPPCSGTEYYNRCLNKHHLFPCLSCICRKDETWTNFMGIIEKNEEGKE